MRASRDPHVEYFALAVGILKSTSNCLVISLVNSANNAVHVRHVYKDINGY